MIDTTGTQHGVHRAYNTALTQQLKKKKGKKNGHEEKKKAKRTDSTFCCKVLYDWNIIVLNPGMSESLDIGIEPMTLRLTAARSAN